MDLFVNERSLHGQFRSSDQFVDALKEIIGCRGIAERYRSPFYCLRIIAQHEALPGVSFKDAVRQTSNRTLISIVMSWLDKHGPFWEDVRRHGSDEWFEHEGEIVTDSSLGEAAFRLADSQSATAISFRESRYCKSPLQIMWQRLNNTSTDLELQNVWAQADLEAYLHAHARSPQSWAELIEQAQIRYQGLTFISDILNPLAGEPFNSTIAEGVLRLLGILNRLKNCYDAETALTAEGHQIMKDFFQGDRALFTDESETNKRTFARQLTFRLPSGEEIFCPYHGKISFRYYRVHHSWPVRPDQPLYIAYIGPKITKS